jgi:hypothetical protein
LIINPIFRMTLFDQNETARRVGYSDFSPGTVPEIFALRLATKLGDGSAAKHYSELVERYPADHLLIAYHRAVAHRHNGNLARRFHDFFEPLKHRDDQNVGNGKSTYKLAAIRVDRRAAGVAVFNGDHLVYARARQLSASPGKAISSAVGFIERIMRQFEVKSAVIEAIPNGHESHRKTLQRAIVGVLDDDEINTGEVSKAELFQAFAFPPLRSRKQLKEIASRIWPILDEQSGGPWIHDAALLGLYVQIEAVFENNNNN